MSNPARWGDTPRLTKSLREGKSGVPAIPLYRPFAGWVARGWRREKYLSMRPAAGEHDLYYLYATAGTAPAGVFDRDADDLLDRFDLDGVEAELVRRQNDPASQVKSAVVGVGMLDHIEDDYEGGSKEWIFAGGCLLPEPIPLSQLLGRPYGGVFYPFGREGR